jgi:hypothetical protein
MEGLIRMDIVMDHQRIIRIIGGYVIIGIVPIMVVSGVVVDGVKGRARHH